MQRVISIQTSRGFGEGDEEFVTKRFCCSFIISVSFIAVLGGFLLGRFSTYREFEIKKTTLETERIVFYEKHNTYLESLNAFTEAFTNFTRTKEIFLAMNDNEKKSVVFDKMWNIFECPNTLKVTKEFVNSAARFEDGDFRDRIETYLKSFMEALTQCVKYCDIYLTHQKEV